MDTRNRILQFESTKSCIDYTKISGEELDNHIIKDSNAWLSTMQFCNRSILFGDFIPNDIMNIEPIKI
jgi:hypothetical protein